jgi:hypothetical protein
VAISVELTFGPRIQRRAKGCAVTLRPTEGLPTWLESRSPGSCFAAESEAVPNRRPDHRCCPSRQETLGRFAR